MRAQIYCNGSPGSLLAAVQMAHLFPDCKSFVDMPLRRGTNAALVLAAWNQLVEESNNAVPREALVAFVAQYFDEPGHELEECVPSDFNPDQTFDHIADPSYRAWAEELHKKWPSLCRRVRDEVKAEPERYSLLALPNAFIVPGGRFRELYYWDSFWTIRGLIASRMFGTVRSMIENMCHLIQEYGFIPNGNRIYYLNRSQPPLLTWCLKAYFDATQDLDFVARSLPWLEKEMEYFTTHKLIHQAGWASQLYQFRVTNATFPRPESFREDYESAEHIEDFAEKCRLWGDIAAAAESGRDFSARWFSNDGPHAGTMRSTRTSQIIPVELNAIICANYRTFGEFYQLLGRVEDSQRAFVQSEMIKEAIHQLFWCEEVGCWFDYDLEHKRQIRVFHDTNLFPLFANAVHSGFNSARIVNYLTTSGLLNYPGGLPSSLIRSSQQWDFPCGWAPTNWIVIQGLRLAGETLIANELAKKWVRKNYTIWRNNGFRMFEKYDVTSECLKSVGGGGEYEVQEGFGWTNGTILDLLSTFSTELAFDPTPVELHCECCRTTPAVVAEAAPQEPIVVVDLPSAAASAVVDNATIAALAAELAQNTPEAAFAEGVQLVRAA